MTANGISRTVSGASRLLATICGAAVSGAAALLFSCGTTGTNDTSSSSATPPIAVFGDVDLDIVAYGGDGVVNLERWLAVTTAGGEIRIDEARVALDEIDLKSEGEDDEDLEFEGPFISRLVAGGTIVNETFPDIGSVATGAETYDRIRFKMEKIEDDEVPDGLVEDALVRDELVGYSVVIEGAFAEAEGNDINGNGSRDEVSFRFKSDDGARIEIESAAGFTVAEGRTSLVYIAFSLDGWFDGALAELQALSDPVFDGGVLLVTSEAGGGTEEIARLIEDNIEGSSRLGSEDDDEDEDDEDDDFDEGEDLDDESSSGEAED